MGNKKKCKYCMSEIDVNAIICPNCRKKQNGGNLALTLSLSIGIPILALLIIIPTVIGIINDKNKAKLQRKAELFIMNAETQYLEELMEKSIGGEEMSDYICYSIDQDEFLGSIEIDYTGNADYIAKIWLSNGEYYASGESNDISIVKSSKTATTNCNKY